MMEPSPNPANLFDEVVRLAHACLAEDISADELARFNHLLETHLEARQIYLRFIQDSRSLHTWSAQDATATASETVSRKATVRSGRPATWLKSLVHDFAQQPLLLAVLVVGIVSVGVLTWRLSRPTGPIARGPIERHPAAPEPGGAVPGVVQQQRQPENDDVRLQAAGPRVARLTRAIGVKWSDSQLPSAIRGPSILRIGDRLMLDRGLVEIVFDTGVKVILEGPAQLVMGSPGEQGNQTLESKNSAYLAAGNLVARVPQQARGFTINTPSVQLVDLGTEFAVQVRAGGGSPKADVGESKSDISHLQSEISPSTEVQVFEGRVAVRGLPPASPNTKASVVPPVQREADGSMILITKQALVVSASDHTFEHRAAKPERFVRQMPVVKPVAIPLFGTGVGLERGSADPHWELVATSDDAGLKPQPVIVIPPYGNYLADSRETGQWISDGPKRQRPPGCRWTVRTHFDLTGFDPATAQIEGSFAVDDGLVGLRLNGQPLPLPARPADPWWRTRTPLQINRGFVAGVNSLEFEIENHTVDQAGFPAKPSPMALLVDWNGTAMPLVQE